MSLTSYRAAPPRVNLTANAGRAARTFFVCPSSRPSAFAGGRGAAPPRVTGLLPEAKRPFELFRQMKGPPEPSRLAARNPVWRADRRREDFTTCALQTWQRPTLPRLETKYHQRWGVSRPCSEWERVQPPRHNHQVGKEHVVSRSCSCRAVRSPP
jgi:hypothetical protein